MNARVLVVDDALSMRVYLNELLVDAGINEVSMASDGEEAISLFNDDRKSFDLVFTDLHMPGRDGMQLISDLGAIKYGGILVVMSNLDNKIASLAANLAKEKSINLIRVLSKPLSKDHIMQCLNQLLWASQPKFQSNKKLSEQELIRSISENRIEPFFQPKVQFNTGKIVGFEVLCRLTSESGKIITPDQFIPVAERFGLSSVLTKGLLETA